MGPKLQGAGRVPRDGFVMMITRQICRIARNQTLELLGYPTSSRGDCQWSHICVKRCCQWWALRLRRGRRHHRRSWRRVWVQHAFWLERTFWIGVLLWRHRVRCRGLSVSSLPKSEERHATVPALRSGGFPMQERWIWAGKRFSGPRYHCVERGARDSWGRVGISHCSRSKACRLRTGCGGRGETFCVGPVQAHFPHHIRQAQQSFS